MCKRLLSLGLDVGTTTTSLILSQLEIENKAGAFSVPDMAITDRKILYRSPVRFTPLLAGELVDGEALRQWVQEQYEKAGICRQQVDTGAVIITGETSRKENAEQVLLHLSGFAGEFVAATAGPHLESLLAAKGSGAVTYSRRTGKTVLHMDMGGGTTNLALVRDGKVASTGCLNVGGRLIRREGGYIRYVSPVAADLCDIAVGDRAEPEKLEAFAKLLCRGLEMAAGLRPATELLSRLATREAGEVWQLSEKPDVISFSGGVADCIAREGIPGQYGDMGVELGQAIRKSLLCAGAYMLAAETIRATVIGAGSHSATLSGSTVFCRDVPLPQKNLPVIPFTAGEQDDPQLPRLIAQRLRDRGQPAVLAFPGYPEGGYGKISALAEAIVQGVQGQILVCLEADMAKALGQRIGLMCRAAPCLCIDRLRLTEDSYLDIGPPLGPAFPVVIKTLVMEK